MTADAVPLIQKDQDLEIGSCCSVGKTIHIILTESSKNFEIEFAINSRCNLNPSIMDGHTEPIYQFQDRPVDDGRPIRVIIIGAGLSGIALYIRLLQHVPNALITIFEKNPSVGGTWFENRYPGVACDIPSHVYQYTFEPHTQWSKFFSPGAEILDYVRGMARKYKVDQKVKYNTKVTEAVWDDLGVWNVQTEYTTPNGEKITSKSAAEVVISAVGILNNWKWPEIDGLHDFEGKLLHSANWDEKW